MRHDEWISDELAALRQAGLERRLTAYAEVGGKIRIGGTGFLNFASNDYLDLTRNPTVVSAAADAIRNTGAGAAASRLVAGTLEIHEELERELAAVKGYPAALVFGSGYMTNTGVIPSLAGRGDHIFADKLVHASIIDGITLSRARLHRFNHNDVTHLERLLSSAQTSGRRLVVTESVFSMDGDIAPLREIAAAAERHGAMCMVDEAHSTGVVGPAGSGLVRELGLESRVHISMGTLSKALGGYGGFVACSTAMRDLIINRARSFIFSTALPPASAAAALAALRILRDNPGMGATLIENAAEFRQRLRNAGLNTGASASQIVPVLIGDNARAISISHKLREHGIIAPVIRPPAVPEGTTRLRLSITLSHGPDDLLRAEEIGKAVREAK